MAIAANCCINLSPPTTTHASTPSSNPSSRTSQLNPCIRVRNEAAWRSQCVAGVACITIGLALTNQSHALTHHVSNISTITEEVTSSSSSSSSSLVAEQRQQIRWSDKRSCPPWSMNSFELTVPENLPRPHTHRRWEPAGHGSRSGVGLGSDHIEKDSSSLVKLVAKGNPKCFSM